MSARIGVVEDDSTIRELVAERLRGHGYDVDTFDSALPLMSETGATSLADLYIVDILLGDSSGLDLCRFLRGKSSTLPILILSALSESNDRVEGLKVGADDYLNKPFEMEELLLRVEGMLKRRSWYGKFPEDRAVFAWEGNSVDFEKLEGKRGFEKFELSPKECMLMKLLIEKEGTVIRREEILDKVWGYDVYPSTRTVDNFILKLRKNFERDPKHPKYIHSVRGMGYVFQSRSES
jgi:two-component system alkaline phosphatase synthesis response regulator PhoP